MKKAISEVQDGQVDSMALATQEGIWMRSTVSQSSRQPPVKTEVKPTWPEERGWKCLLIKNLLKQESPSSNYVVAHGRLRKEKYFANFSLGFFLLFANSSQT